MNTEKGGKKVRLIEPPSPMTQIVTVRQFCSHIVLLKETARIIKVQHGPKVFLRKNIAVVEENMTKKKFHMAIPR